MNAIIIKRASEITSQQNRGIQQWLKKRKYRMQLQKQKKDHEEYCERQKKIARNDMGDNAFIRAFKK